MKILVTGARGQVGRVATSHLVQAGHEVTYVDLLPPDREAAVDARYVQTGLINVGCQPAPSYFFDLVLPISPSALFPYATFLVTWLHFCNF